ncbi:hypothetical protein AMTR_s00016p00210160 [Amborella trichopoda]|uniref:Uncharacterized protein n=1 Tax=Amborella trichopoda TaxID=13333 RepID=W1PGQ6_AMBTC|nr:hypothetical protein AMTR_s00016p00210160 [Amborella trichopoda]
MGKIYPSAHCHVAHRIHSSLMPSFDMLDVDPLALMVIEENDHMLVAGEMAQDVVDDLEDDAMVLEDDLNMGVVTLDQHPPINTIPMEQCPLLLHFTLESSKNVNIVYEIAVKEVSVDVAAVKEAPVDLDIHKLNTMASDCGMNFNIPIGVVFHKIICKKKL